MNRFNEGVLLMELSMEYICVLAAKDVKSHISVDYVSVLNSKNEKNH